MRRLAYIIRDRSQECSLHCRQIPRAELPSRIGSMELTPALLDDYAGHEMLLQFRARHNPHCYPTWDKLRDCIVGRERGEEACAAAARAFKPCAAEQARSRAAAARTRDDERRRVLAARAREQQEAAAAAATSSASGAPPSAPNTAAD